MNYRINSPKVISEGFDNESVVVNLDNGNYYNMENSSFIIWNALLIGHNNEEVVQKVTDTFSNENKDTIGQEVQAFIQELIEEELIVESDVRPIEKMDLEFTKQQYTTPSLTKFTDMQGLLLIDPIHEVEEKGWPHKKKESAQS